MSPEENAGLNADRLRDEVCAELARIGRVVQDLEQLRPSLLPGASRDTCMAAAGYLHAFYTGCEAVLSRVARAFGDLPEGPRWHQRLLFESTAAKEGLRPPVLTPETAAPLMDLLRFRHFFRLAYGVSLDTEKLRRHAGEVSEAMRVFERDVRVFLERLATG